MDLNAAQVFVQVAAAGGFTAAARQLKLPKSTVSKKVGELEAQLGVRLLNRTTRSLSLTEAGGRVLSHCRAAVAHMEEAEREARALQREPAGHLVIAAPPAIALSSVMPAVDAFLDRYPMVQITLLSSNDLDDLNEGRADVMIWAAAVMPPGHAVQLVADVAVGLYASMDYLARHGVPAAPEDLVHHAAIGFTQVREGRSFAWPLERGSEIGLIAPAVAPRFTSNDAMAVMAAVMAGHGIGGLPLAMVAALPQGAALVRVLPGWQAAPVKMGALFRDGASSSLKIRLFLDFLSAWFRQGGGGPAAQMA